MKNTKSRYRTRCTRVDKLLFKAAQALAHASIIQAIERADGVRIPIDILKARDCTAEALGKELRKFVRTAAPKTEE